jgi:hypothetical protein
MGKWVAEDYGGEVNNPHPTPTGISVLIVFAYYFKKKKL